MEFLKKYNISLKDESLINMALTHSSYTNEKEGSNYERLEFLGDAVLQLIISEYYYLNSELTEGEMSKRRASYVCESALYEYAKELDILDKIKVGTGLINNVNATVAADVVEAIIGAIYISNGYEDAKSLIYKLIIPYIENNVSFFDDYKTVLQEMVQTTKDSLEYVLVSETGPAHDRTFTVEVRIDNIVFGVGTGKTKKEAEQQAAFSAYQKRAKNW